MLINSTDNLITGIMRHGPDILEKCLAESSNDLEKYLVKVDQERLHYPLPLLEVDTNRWHIPKEYQNIDIEKFLVDICPEENYNRLIEELELYQKNDMIIVLKTMKYIVDTLRSNKIVWGVGRGSSVASYVLFLLGVHKIDSVKYKLPIEEFFKGEKNG